MSPSEKDVTTSLAPNAVAHFVAKRKAATSQLSIALISILLTPTVSTASHNYYTTIITIPIPINNPPSGLFYHTPNPNHKAGICALSFVFPSSKALCGLIAKTPDSTLQSVSPAGSARFSFTLLRVS